MTVFKDDFDLLFVSLFTILFILKVYHWLLKDRIDFMEQTPAWSRLFKARMLTCLFAFGVCDVMAVILTAHDLIVNGPSMQLLFCFEYFILLVNDLTYCMRYMLNVVESQYETMWNEKSKYLFYLELITDFIKLTAYLLFFVVVINFYGLPLHIIRDLFMTLRSFIARIKDWVQYHRATANMDERYPDATTEELEATDKLCIICREEMSTSAKKLPCGHIFHVNCLKSWLERQQTCPTCRRTVLEPVNIPRGGPVPGQQVIGQVQINNGAARQNNNNELPRSNGTSPSTQHADQRTNQTDSNRPDSNLGIPVIIIPQGNMNSPADFSNESQTPIILSNASLPSLVDLNPSNNNNLSSFLNNSNNQIILDHLTDEQLLKMEGNLRNNVIARIKFLQTIQSEISSIVTKVTQYQLLLDNLNHVNNSAMIVDLDKPVILEGSSGLADSAVEIEGTCSSSSASSHQRKMSFDKGKEKIKAE